VKKEVK